MITIKVGIVRKVFHGKLYQSPRKPPSRSQETVSSEPLKIPANYSSDDRTHNTNRLILCEQQICTNPLAGILDLMDIKALGFTFLVFSGDGGGV